MKKYNMPEDEKRRECLISVKNEREKRGERVRKKNDYLRGEKRRTKKKMKPCLF